MPKDKPDPRPVRIMYRKELAPGQDEAALVAAWQRCTRAICGKARGALGGKLFRVDGEPTKFVAVMEWASVEDWRAYWRDGVPDPMGDPRRNEILCEVAELPCAL